MNDKKNTNKTNEETEKMPDGKVHPVTEADSEHSDYIREEDGTVTKIYHIRHEDPEVTKQKEQRRLKLRRKRRRLRIWTVILSVLVLFNVVVASFGLLIAKRMVEDAPTLDVTDFIGEESSKIYDDEGNLVTEVGVYLRENITYDQLPESVVDAFLSIEDSRFFTHNGFDIPRFTMAIIQNLKTRSFGQGGSTFTMQLVKNTYFTVDSMDASNTGKERTKSIEYKVQQIYLAMELEKLISKKEIFQLYLNKLNFGGNIRGIQRASEYYFGKNVSEINLPEAAMLAGIVNLPNRYNPYDYLDYGTTRRNEVLYQMLNHGYITESEYNLAKSVKVEDTLVGDSREAAENSQYQAYLDAVLSEAQQMTGEDPTVKGMQIYTYLNRTIQEEIEAIQNGERSDTVLFPDDLMQIGIVSMNNKTGAIVGIGGGRNYDGARLLNRATMNFKQPGSSVKPVISYALAFEYLGYSLDEILMDKPITYPGESRVLVDASGNYLGDVSIKDATGLSLNIPAILTLEKVVDKVGKAKVASYLQSIGYTRVTQDNFHLSFAIGGTWFETTPLEMAGAHAMLMNYGVYNQPHTINKIIMTSSGEEYYPEGQNRKVLSSGSAWMAAQLMQYVVDGPHFNFTQLLKRDYPVYAKTGTTDWGSDGLQYGIPQGQMKDKWMVTSTNMYTNAVWVGYDKAVAGAGTYYTSAKQRLNIPGNINKLLLDAEDRASGDPGTYEEPTDVEDVTYVYGTYPHVAVEDWMPAGVSITSQVSSAGLEAQPTVSVAEYLDYQASQQSSTGLHATYDGAGNVSINWYTGTNSCSGGQKDISLHDDYNDIEKWGACMVDLSWLNGSSGNGFWANVSSNGVAVGNVSSDTSSWSGYVGDLSAGNVQVCGGFTKADGTASEQACTVAVYTDDVYGSTTSSWGYYDASGNYVDAQLDYSQYGYWDENGTWVGSGWWDTNGYHMG